jgi:hypothetical protein
LSGGVAGTCRNNEERANKHCGRTHESLLKSILISGDDTAPLRLFCGAAPVDTVPEIIPTAAPGEARRYPDRIAPKAAEAALALKSRTLTNLYDERPRAADAHDALDRAVASAYGWPEAISTGDALARLLALNSNEQRAAPPSPHRGVLKERPSPDGQWGEGPGVRRRLQIGEEPRRCPDRIIPKTADAAV